MAKSLIFATHDAIAELCAAILCHHCRNDGVKRALAAGNAVRMIRIDDKALATIMQQHPAFRRHDAGAKPVIQGVDQAAGIPVAIDNADIDGALVARQLAWWQWVNAGCIADLGAKLGRVGRVKHPVHWHIDMRRVGKHRTAVTIGKAPRLDLVMDPHG